MPAASPDGDQLCGTHALVELAPAKINLALHVVGQRADGYHLLESIVDFVSMGDVLRFRNAASDELHICGPFASLLPLDGPGSQANLVVRARDLLRLAFNRRGWAAPAVSIRLEKNLPVASGIGGGSADAAATLRGLQRLWGETLDEAELFRIGLSLGADVPMCLKSTALLARGIGETLSPLGTLPRLPMVIGNPMVGVATADIFRRLPCKDNPQMLPFSGRWDDDLPAMRNDLEPVARSLVPEIGEISRMIASQGALWTRMSGSGATCFGVFDSMETAQKAVEQLQRHKPHWYFAATETFGGSP